MLSADLADRPAKDDGGPGLGRVIFRRDHSIGTGKLIAFAVLAILGTLAGVGLGFAAMNNGFPVKMTILAGCLAFIPIPAWVGAFLARVNVFRCHAKGVCRETPRGETQLRYEDVAGFTYSATRNYTNGAYTGTALALTFEPRDPTKQDRVSYSATIRNADAELDNLRDFVGRMVAGTMLARLKAGNNVPWTGGAVFTPDGLELPPGGLFGRGESRVVPFGEITGHDFKDGTFYLFRVGAKKSVFSASASSGNFFPGYYLLLALLPDRTSTA